MNVRKKNPAGTVLTVMLLAALLTICLELGLSYLRPDTPGSIPKHLIHFAIMFALLGGAVLLCLFCPPFKKLWAWIDEHILDKETRPIAIDIIYAVIAGLMLLHHFYVLIYYPSIMPSGATRFAPVWIVFAALTILLSKSWREISFLIATIFLIYTFERLYVQNPYITGNGFVYFSAGIYSLFFCFKIFSVLRSSLHKTFIIILCVFWTISTLIICFIGLYSTWTGHIVENPGDAWTRILDGRLRIFSPASITAGYLGTGIIMAIIGGSFSKHKSVRFLFFLSSFVAIVTNSLTDSRSSFLAVSFIISAIICLSAWTIYKNKQSLKHTFSKPFLIISLILCFSLCFYITVEGQRILGAQFIEIRNNRGFFPIAEADESTLKPTIPPVVQEFIQRDVWFSDESNISKTLNGRIEIWEKGFKYIQDNPDTLLYGLSIDGSVAPIVGREDHSHNLLIQTLLEGGIPALLLYLSLVCYGIFHAFRLWNRRGVPFWQRILPLPAFSILLWEMAECLTHFSYGHPPMTLFWFFLGATITVSKSLGKAPKASEQPAIPAESAVTETGE